MSNNQKCITVSDFIQMLEDVLDEFGNLPVESVKYSDTQTSAPCIEVYQDAIIIVGSN